jgi:Ca2+/Na+ antiporter
MGFGSFLPNVYLVCMVICIIVYLGGQIDRNKYRKSDTIYVMIMLILTLIGTFIVKFVKAPHVLIVTLLITCGAMLGANIVIYTTKKEEEDEEEEEEEEEEN